MTAPSHPDAPPTLLYDEKCSVCKRFVSLLIRADRGGEIRIAPLQGPLGQKIRAEHPELSSGDSAIWVPPKGPVVGHSEAILGALAQAGGLWKTLARVGRLCPSSIRDWAYRVFARNRRYFGWLGLAELDQRSRQRQRENHAGERR